MAAFTPEDARRFYDRFGKKQDWQSFYEDRAVSALLERGGFEHARAVVELGCGTGRIAARILDRLPGDATYLGVDVSGTMVALARERLARFGPRARVLQTEGGMRLPVADSACDRFVTTYVLDLLPDEQIRAAFSEARRVLEPAGRFCVVSLTCGEGRATRLVSSAWTAIQRRWPRMVGGCRPISLLAFVDEGWLPMHREVVSAFGIASEVLVAAKAG